jgi:hypothetical protein
MGGSRTTFVALHAGFPSPRSGRKIVAHSVRRSEKINKLTQRREGAKMCIHNRLVSFAGLASLRLCVKCFCLFPILSQLRELWVAISCDIPQPQRGERAWHAPERISAPARDLGRIDLISQDEQHHLRWVSHGVVISFAPNGAHRRWWRCAIPTACAMGYDLTPALRAC